MRPDRRLRLAGFTLVELLIVVALVAIVLTLAGPSFADFIQMQRLRGINAQLVTDIQFARSEAVSRNVPVHMKFQTSEQMSCYVMYTTPTSIQSSTVASECDCTRAEGLRCGGSPATEVRTVQVAASVSVRLAPLAGQPPNFAFDPRTGGIQMLQPDSGGPLPGDFSIDAFIDTSRKVRDTISLAGRVKVCTPAGSTMSEVAC